MIIGTGTDILETRYIKKIMDAYGRKFLERWFSDEEISYCLGRNRPHLHAAARMAAKEAAAKALRLPREGPLPWKDISVVRGKDGEPTLSLSGRTLERARQLGVVTLHVSMSHCDDYATATVVAES